MNCLTCRHLIVSDGDSRLFVCGHDSLGEIDSNDGAPSIVSAEYDSSMATIVNPAWCPLRPLRPSGVGQLELFAGDE